MENAESLVAIQQPPVEAASADVGQTWPPPWLRSRWAIAAALIVTGLALFSAYLGQAGVLATTSDSGVKALQAWDMFHGNPLLRGWTTSDVSFYTTELPEYAVIEMLRGLNGGVVHIAGALNYTLLVLLAGLLAKGRAAGREGMFRFLIAAGIMLAPQLHPGTYLFLAGPDHLGTQIPLVLVLLLLDRARPKWWVPVLVGLLLTWVMIADALALYELAIPLIIVCAIRIYRERRIHRERGTLAGNWMSLSLIGAAVFSIGTAKVVITAIRQAGGMHEPLVIVGLDSIALLTVGVWKKLENLLAVFGADFLSHHRSLPAIFALIHLVGLAAAIWAVIRTLRRFAAADMINQILAIAFVFITASYIFGTKPDANEIVGLLPLGAVLAARVLAPRLTAARRFLPAAAALLACAVLMLAYDAVQPASRSNNQKVAEWLVAHHLRYGLAGYWQASSIATFSGNQAKVRPVRLYGDQLVATYEESEADWYDSGRHFANFVVLTTNRGCDNDCLSLGLLDAAYGKPAAYHNVGEDIIVIWHTNLLRKVRILFWCGKPWSWASHEVPTTQQCPSQ
jgi:hypothetical protein